MYLSPLYELAPGLTQTPASVAHDLMVRRDTPVALAYEGRGSELETLIGPAVRERMPPAASSGAPSVIDPSALSEDPLSVMPLREPMDRPLPPRPEVSLPPVRSSAPADPVPGPGLGERPNWVAPAGTGPAQPRSALPLITAPRLRLSPLATDPLR